MIKRYSEYADSLEELLNEKKIYNIIVEELTKSEVNAMIASKIDSSYSSRDFKKKVKELSADVINEFLKILWQRNSIWKSNVIRA